MKDLYALIPQRPPFLMLDEITALEAGIYGTGKKYIRSNEYYFKGHFPEKPVMPAVLIIEAAAQLANAVIRSKEGYQNKYVYFSKMSKTRFLKPAFPGDCLSICVKVNQEIEGLFFCSVFVKIEETEIFQSEIVFNTMDTI